MAQAGRQDPARAAKEREPSRSKSGTSGRTWIRTFWRAMRGTRGVKKEVGQYRILRPLAQGGMTEVFLGETVDQGRPIVVKFLLEGAGEVVAERMRFQRAARIGAVMDHVHIAGILYGGDWDGQLCIVEEYVNGVDLAKWLKQHRAIPLEVALLIMRDLSSAVAHVHERGVVHRDLKPANVMFSVDGAVKLMDFGIARRLDESLDVTEMGVAPATVSYAAPEQLEAHSASEIGRHTDVWALGVMCYELFSGERPFVGEPREVRRQILSRNPQPLTVLKPELPTGLAQQVMRMLTRDIDHRCGSAEEVLDALEHGIDELGIRNQGRLLRTYARDPENVRSQLDATRRERVEDVARTARGPVLPDDPPVPVEPSGSEDAGAPRRPLSGTIRLTDPLATVPQGTQVTRAATPDEVDELRGGQPADPPARLSDEGRPANADDEIELSGPRRWQWLLGAAVLVAVVGLSVPQVRDGVFGRRQVIRSAPADTSARTPAPKPVSASAPRDSATIVPAVKPPVEDMRPTTARLRIVPVPPDAKVVVDRTWPSSGRFDRPAMSARRHTVFVDRAGFVTQMLSVVLSGGRDTTVTVTLVPEIQHKPIPPVSPVATGQGFIEIDVSPAAEIYVDKVLRANSTRKLLQLDPGKYTITARAGDFPEKTWANVVIASGATAAPLLWNFQATTGYLKVRSANDFYGEISLDEVGQTLTRRGLFLLAPGKYHMHVRHPGFVMDNEPVIVNVSAGDTVPVQYTLRKL